MAKRQKTNDKDRRRKDPKTRQQIIRLYDRGKSTQEIAKKLNVPRGSVSAWVAHYTRGTYDA
jgi:transposase-like protein